jgi:hypothetical protein
MRLPCFMAATFLDRAEQPPLTNPDFYDPVAKVSDRTFGYHANNGVFVARSDDGGLSWNQPPVAVVSHLWDGGPSDPVFFETTPDLAIDTFRQLPDGSQNPRFGTLYVVWTRLYPPGRFPGHPEFVGAGDVMIAVSLDGGQSWTTQFQPGTDLTVIQDPANTETGLAGASYVDQPHLAIGPEGDVYVSQFGAGDFAVHHSTDGGAHFLAPDHTSGLGIALGLGEANYANGLPQYGFRTFAARAIAADPTRPGWVYAVEAVRGTDAAGNPIDGGDIVFDRSKDYGATWEVTADLRSARASILNDDNGHDRATGLATDEVISGQALPRLSVDAQGDIAVIWYDTRHDPLDHNLDHFYATRDGPPAHLLDVFGTVSTDGGSTFSPNFRVTDTSFNADQARFTDARGNDNFDLGDAISLAVANHTAYAAWTDTRHGNQDVFFSRFPLNPAPPPPHDRFEPNDTLGTATDLGTVFQRVLPRLALPPGDEDWFRLKPAARNLTLSALPAAPGERLRLELWDESGATLLAVGTSLEDPNDDVIEQEIRFAGSPGRTYLLHVSPVDLAAGAPGGNLRCLQRFRYEVVRLWRKWLARRKRRGQFAWDRLNRLLKALPLPWPPRGVPPCAVKP